MALDSQGDYDNNEISIAKLDESSFAQDSQFLGMKQKMVYDGQHFQVHCIFGSRSENSLAYLIVSLEEFGPRTAQVFKNNAGGEYHAMEAVFIGSQTNLINGALLGYEAYWVGGEDSQY